MRPAFAASLPLIPLLALAQLACRSAPAPQPPSPAERRAAEGRVGAFSADRAWEHLTALAAIGPRASGTPGAAKAREYIRGELAELGLEVISLPLVVDLEAGAPELQIEDLEATVRGRSPDLILLAAPYDSPYFENSAAAGGSDGASGAALLLELARVLVADPLPYTVRFLFFDGEAPLRRGNAEEAEMQLVGSTGAAMDLEKRGQLEAVRLLILLNRVSDADLRIARDRFSHRIYRDAFWRAAAELGYGDVFPLAADFEAPMAGHRSFIDRGMRRVVAIVGNGGESPDLDAGTEEDTLERSSPESLAAVGRVTLAALESISARLAKIDRFSRAPLRGGAESAVEGDGPTSAKGEVESAAEARAATPPEPEADAP